MSVATTDDVETALGRPLASVAEIAQVGWWLDGVELFIVNRLGAVDLLVEDAVRYVEVEAVVAKIRRAGTNESSITVAVDDGSVTRRYENAVSAGDITDEWWSLLDVDSGRATGSIRPSFDADTAQWAVGTPFAPGYYSTEPGWR